MNDTDPLAGLRGLHDPAPIPLWPPAPGWWIVSGSLLLLAAGLGGWAWWRRRRGRDPRRAALAELANLETRFRTDGDATALATGVSVVLKRSALVRFERQRVASLTGEAWLQFLDATGHCTAFTHGAGRVLATAPYRPGVAVDPEPLLAAAREWIQQAGRQAGR
ncbi:MAG: DUF4381 domain-containing protein [Magnetococcales bacterium]|nr:DUF4381 domain-containing protein [Magnetococcales bacterium]